MKTLKELPLILLIMTIPAFVFGIPAAIGLCIIKRCEYLHTQPMTKATVLEQFGYWLALVAVVAILCVVAYKQADERSKRRARKHWED